MATSKPPRRSSGSHRSTLSLQKTEIKINVYDLLPPGRLSTVLWTLGSSLLHTGVVINNREFAYGGHDKQGHTGVYRTKPRAEPPGGTFRCEILQGFTFRSLEEINAIVKEASIRFQGPAYNLLTYNCNHFTSYLCAALTSRPAPRWLNRAASIGVTLPCIVPRDWLAPPDYDTADGTLLEDEHVEPNRIAHLSDESEEDDRIGKASRGREASESRGLLSGMRKSQQSRKTKGSAASSPLSTGGSGTSASRSGSR